MISTIIGILIVALAIAALLFTLNYGDRDL